MITGLPFKVPKIQTNPRLRALALLGVGAAALGAYVLNGRKAAPLRLPAPASDAEAPHETARPAQDTGP